MTTAAELLRNAAPPADDGLIDKAIADLDARIWEWTDALKSAHAQLRTAFAARPSSRLSESLYESVPQGFSATTAGAPSSILEAAAAMPAPTVAAPMPAVADVPAPPVPAMTDVPAPPLAANLSAAAAAAHIPTPPMPAGLQAAAAAAHIPSPPPMPAEWTAPPPPVAPAPAAPAWMPSHGGHGMTAAGPSAPMPSVWPEPAPPKGEPSSTGVMQWPTVSAAAWPDSSSSSASASASGPQEWPTWTPTDTSKKTVTSAPPRKQQKAAKPIEGPSPEERAQKAAAEEALLSQLDDAIARRVRLLRRLDPDTPIEKLIEKARQGQAEAAASSPAREDKSSSSSWWRRK